MKMLRVTLYTAAVVLAAVGFAPPALAFHSGGVAECEGCHTMHNSLENAPTKKSDGTPIALPQFEAGPYLLKGSDQSSACLNCHQHAGDVGPSSYHISTAPADMAAGAPLQRTPGGDFGWLKKDYTFLDRDNVTVLTNTGERRGHSIVAADYGYVADTVQGSAPGGPAGAAYPANQLYCSSCHDPHGKYRRDATGAVATSGLPIRNSGSYGTSLDPVAGVYATGVYRLLGGVGYMPKSIGTNAFTAPPPLAVAPSTYNQSEATNIVHVAYGTGMSEWCGNCHGRMVNNAYVSAYTPGVDHVHPAGSTALLPDAIINNYNAYVKTGNVSGAQATSYNSLAPFEEGDNVTFATLKTHAVNNAPNGPGPTIGGRANVMCLSCHRAHASGFESMARYSLANEFVTFGDGAGVPSYPDPTVAAQRFAAQGMPAVDTQAAYYDRPATFFAPYQRNYCNKCHVKD